MKFLPHSVRKTDIKRTRSERWAHVDDDGYGKLNAYAVGIFFIVFIDMCLFINNNFIGIGVKKSQWMTDFWNPSR